VTVTRMASLSSLPVLDNTLESKATPIMGPGSSLFRPLSSGMSKSLTLKVSMALGTRTFRMVVHWIDSRKFYSAGY
jgi:hypothetical protein